MVFCQSYISETSESTAEKKESASSRSTGKNTISTHCYSLSTLKELDLKILEDLAVEEREETALQTARREKAKADARSMMKVQTLSC